MAKTYRNIGSVYNNMKDDSSALQFFEKALEIQEKCLSS
jgi:tetratricopeptide (TPR) repeat protein